MSETVARPALDLLDGESYVYGAHERFAWFRQHEPVAWDDGNELWGVFRYADVSYIETHDDVFISSDRTKGGYRPDDVPGEAERGVDVGAQPRRHTVRRRVP